MLVRVVLCWPVAMAARPRHGGGWRQWGRGLGLVARGVAPAFRWGRLVRRAGAHLAGRLVPTAAAAVLHVQVGMSVGPRRLWMGWVACWQGVERESLEIVTRWPVGGYSGPSVPVFGLSVPLPLQLSLSVSLPVQRQLPAPLQPRIPLPVELSGYLGFPGSPQSHFPLLKLCLSVPMEAIAAVQPQAVISHGVFSSDAAVSARAARGWQTIHQHYVVVGWAGGRFGVVWVGVMVTVRGRRVVVGAKVIFPTVEATRGGQRVVVWVAVRVRGKVR